MRLDRPLYDSFNERAAGSRPAMIANLPVGTQFESEVAGAES
jgi:hypothetical protein